MAICNGDTLVEVIEATECIGNSLVKINNNFKALDVSACQSAGVASAILSIDGLLASDGIGNVYAGRPGQDYYLPGQTMDWDVVVFGSATISNNVTLLPGASLRVISGNVNCVDVGCVNLNTQRITCSTGATIYGNLDVGIGIFCQVMKVATDSTFGGTAGFSGKITANGGLDCVGTLKVTGGITATGNIQAYTSSDKRLKKDITQISNALEKVNSLQGVEFEWDENLQSFHQGKDTGVIAQEVEEVMPTAVRNGEDGYKSVQYDRLIPLLIEAVKELTEQNAVLKQEIEALKSK